VGLERRQLKNSIVVALAFFFTVMLVTGNVHSRPNSYQEDRLALIIKARADLKKHQRDLRVEVARFKDEQRKSDNLKNKVTLYKELFNSAKQRALFNDRLKRKEFDRTPSYKREYDYHRSLYELSQRRVKLQVEKVAVAKKTMELSQRRVNQMSPPRIAAPRPKQSARARYCRTGICCPPYKRWICEYLDSY